MNKVTFQVLEGVDKGRIFRDLVTPITIGREEGNIVRLNDERVSRYHAKVQQDNGDVILTDLESTNGTRVNGAVVQIRRLRIGDRVAVGRSLLLFGSNEEIAGRIQSLTSQPNTAANQDVSSALASEGPATVQARTSVGPAENDFNFELNVQDRVTLTSEAMFIGTRALPPLPQKLTPSQAARMAEILDFLHRGLTCATDNIQAKEDGSQVTLSFADWQKVLAVQMLLARYLRAVAEPESMAE